MTFVFALIPFAYAKRTVNFYDNHIKEELETALSIITTSYVRTDDIVTAVKENVQYLKPPVKDIFAGFVAENMMISSDIKQSIVCVVHATSFQSEKLLRNFARTSLPLAAQMNEVEALPQMMLRQVANDVGFAQ